MSMIQISKRQKGTSKLVDVLIRIGAIVLSLIFIGIVLAIMGYDPFKVFGKIIQTPFKRFKDVMNKTIMLTTLSLGIAIAFRMKFWNIGAEGQFYMGAFGAASMAFMCPDLPPILLLPLMCVAGFICGGLWALIPAVIKAKFGASETLVTLMMNYIAIAFISYLQYGPWKDPAALGAAKVPNFSENAVLPDVFGIHAGWIIMLVLVIIMTILLRYTKLGYQIDVIGESETTAKYAGMNTVKILVIAVLISGGLCGMAGFMQSSAVDNRFDVGRSWLYGGNHRLACKAEAACYRGCVVYVLDTSPERKLASGNEDTLVHYGNNAGRYHILRSCVRVLYKL